MPPLRRSMRRTARRTARRTTRRQNAFYNEPEETVSDQESMDYTDELEKLAKLRDEGAITEKEYAAKKKQILDL
jgi:hypothetical protein